MKAELAIRLPTHRHWLMVDTQSFSIAMCQMLMFHIKHPIPPNVPVACVSWLGGPRGGDLANGLD